MTGAKELADSITDTLMGIPSLTEYDDDEVLEIPIRLIHVTRRDKTMVGTKAVYGTTKVAEKVVDTVEPVVDMRKARSGKSIEIGTVEVYGDGTVKNIDIEEEYLKPTEKGE